MQAEALSVEGSISNIHICPPWDWDGAVGKPPIQVHIEIFCNMKFWTCSTFIDPIWGICTKLSTINRAFGNAHHNSMPSSRRLGLRRTSAGGLVVTDPLKMFYMGILDTIHHLLV